MNDRKRLITVCVIALSVSFTFSAFGQKKKRTPPTAEQKAKTVLKHAKEDVRRKEIPLGGDFKPNPKDPVIVAADMGLRIVMSRDDGKTWNEVFFGFPAHDHSAFATFDVAYTNGLFAISSGWGSGGRGTIIASEDGIYWRHLTGPNRKGRHDAYGMGDSMGIAGGNGVIVNAGTSIEATQDFGKSWIPYNVRKETGLGFGFHHMGVIFGDYDGGRFFAWDGAGENVVYSKDLGKTWAFCSQKNGWVEGEKGLYAGMAYGNGVFLMLDGNGALVRRTADGGETWTAHKTGASKPSSNRKTGMFFVNGEFWINGKTPRKSKDGITWTDLHDGLPAGHISQTDKGTYINVSTKRTTILRSEDGKQWDVVYTMTPHPDSGKIGFIKSRFGYVNAYARGGKK